MVSTSAARKRSRGEIETLPSGSLRVRVYAGVDPVSKKKHYLVETVPSGPAAARDAEKVRTRLLAQVDERRNPRTRATLNQLLDRFLEVVELELTTRRGYVGKLDRHVRGPYSVAFKSGGSMLRRWSRSMPPSVVAVTVATAASGTATESKAGTNATADAAPTCADRSRRQPSDTSTRF
jgi:hypothetical protein